VICKSKLDASEYSRVRDSVEKLAMAGQHAGFSVEQMIELLNSGMTVDTLLDLLVWRINALTGGVQLCGKRQESSSLKVS